MPTIPKGCPNCHELLKLSAAQKRLLAKATEQGRPILALQCPACDMGFVVKLKAEVAKGEDAYTYRCPTSGCDGHVVKIAAGSATSPWGCGECGGEWKSRTALVEDIRKVILRYPYRARCYVEKSGDLLPAAPSREPAKYEDLVGDEPVEPGPTLSKKAGKAGSASPSKRRKATKHS